MHTTLRQCDASKTSLDMPKALTAWTRVARMQTDVLAQWGAGMSLVAFLQTVVTHTRLSTHMLTNVTHHQMLGVINHFA